MEREKKFFFEVRKSDFTFSDFERKKIFFKDARLPHW